MVLWKLDKYMLKNRSRSISLTLNQKNKFQKDQGPQLKTWNSTNRGIGKDSSQDSDKVSNKQTGPNDIKKFSNSQENCQSNKEATNRTR